MFYFVRIFEGEVGPIFIWDVSESEFLVSFGFKNARGAAIEGGAPEPVFESLKCRFDVRRARNTRRGGCEVDVGKEAGAIVTMWAYDCFREVDVLKKIDNA